MKISNLMRMALVGAGAVMLWGVAPGCKASVSSYCDKVCECVGCSEPEREDCTDTLEDARKNADADGCGSQFDEVLSCASSELTCTDGQIDSDGCEIEAEKLSECTSGVPGVGINPCDVAVDQLYAKYEECGIEVEGNGGEDVECTDTIEQTYTCLTACTVAASCETLRGEDAEGAMAYSQCVGGC